MHKNFYRNYTYLHIQTACMIYVKNIIPSHGNKNVNYDSLQNIVIVAFHKLYCNVLLA